MLVFVKSVGSGGWVEVVVVWSKWLRCGCECGVLVKVLVVVVLCECS